MAAFDWYQATIPHPVDDVLQALSALEPGLSLSYERGMHGFAHAAVLGSAQEGPIARVLHGGTHEYPHAILSGEWAQPGAEAIRAAFPRHSVSRVDVREDFTDEGAYDAIQVKLLAAARLHRVKVGTAGDHLVTMRGRTCYLGASSSNCRMRLYDKREEVLSKLPPGGVGRHLAFAQLPPMPDHWARLESQIRPKTKEAKEHFASIEPVEALGSSEWMREVWCGVAGLELKPVQVGRGWRQADDERAYRYMLSQYGGVLQRMHRDAGSWECVGLQLGEDLKRG